MKTSLAAALSMAVMRAVAIVLGAVALCACILGAVGFALAALYSLLAPELGPASAAFATSGAALIMPALVTAAILVATRSSSTLRLPEAVVADAAAHRKQPPGNSIGPALDWITANPRAATLGALGLGVALGASPDLRRTVLQGLDSALAEGRASIH